MAAAQKRVTGGRGSTGDGEKEEIEVKDDQETAEEESSDVDETATSEYGRFFKAGEVRMMAQYIARYNPDDWAMMTGKQRWLPYHLEVIPGPGDQLKAFANLRLSVQHPHRSEVSYSMKYRSKKNGVFSVIFFWTEDETFS